MNIIYKIELKINFHYFFTFKNDGFCEDKIIIYHVY